MLEVLSEVGLWDGFDLDEVQWFSAGPVVLPSSNRGHLEVCSFVGVCALRVL